MPTVITKAIAEIQPGADDATSDNGTFDVILSAPTKDRDGDTLKADEWKMPLPDHITFDVDHGMSVATTVGSGTPRIDPDGTLRVSGSYSSIPRAQEVRTLVNEKHIRTTSVAFMTTKSTKGAKPERELLNGAFVAVPSNREAVVLSSKAFGAIEKEGKRNSAADQSKLQDAHDALVGLGAMCDAGAVDVGGEKSAQHKAALRAARKSIVGSVEALQDRVNDALEDAYASDGYGYWGWLRGVVPNAAGDGGTIVFQSSCVTPSYESAIYQQSYTDDGAVVTLVGQAVEVDIHEIVVPDADADRETDTTLTTLNLGEKDVTSSADQQTTGKPADAVTANDERDLLTVRARALALQARAAAL